MSACTCTAIVLDSACPVHATEVNQMVADAINNDAVIYTQPRKQCELCGEVKETRPYGPNGEDVCFPCGMKDEASARRAFGARLGVAGATSRKEANDA